MSEGPEAKLAEELKPQRSLWDRLVSPLRRRGDLRIEDILRAAKKGRLDQLLTSHYTIYTDPSWREKLQLCRDLKEAGLILAAFKNDWDGTTPIFMEGQPRITIDGRDYLSRIEQSKPWRRILGLTLAFVLGLLSSFGVKWLDLFIEVYAKKHGLK